MAVCGAKVLGARIPSADWKRVTEWRWGSDSFYKVDYSRVQVQLLVDHDGKVVEGKGMLNTAAFNIHGQIHKAIRVIIQIKELELRTFCYGPIEKMMDVIILVIFNNKGFGWRTVNIGKCPW